jgi:hypothetical protein
MNIFRCSPFPLMHAREYFIALIAILIMSWLLVILLQRFKSKRVFRVKDFFFFLLLLGITHTPEGIQTPILGHSSILMGVGSAIWPKGHWQRTSIVLVLPSFRKLITSRIF